MVEKKRDFFCFSFFCFVVFFGREIDMVLVGMFCRFCTTGLPSDIVIEVDDMTFHLHKVGLEH